MKIGILSDTHDQVARTSRALDALTSAGAEILIHCGDLTTPDVVHVCGSAERPCYYVLGNNDFDERGLRTAMAATGGHCLGRGGEIELGGWRIAVTHGDDTRMFRTLLAAMPDVLLSGHTHVRLDERDGPTWQINPGALHRAREWTVALLNLSSERLRFMKIP